MVILSEVIPAPGASSSSSSCSSSSAYDHNPIYVYDVFLSFRGVDTRNGFTDHLYNALLDAGITTFLDDEEIETGERLKPELEGAIRSSRASIIVLSKNYASSTWCLDELVLILEQKRNFKKKVIPIFYHVEPTDVRKQQNSFGEAMDKHKQRMEAEANAEKRSELAQKMESWKNALTDVATLKGKDAKDMKETELIKEVVADIHRRLRVPLSNTVHPLTGRDYEIHTITSWLTDGSLRHTADILTIVGMSGIGKTSLARHVFGLHSGKFEKSSFIEGINTKSNDLVNGLLDLQKQLHADIAKKIELRVSDVVKYTSIIENVLARKRVFVVLDDVGSLDQLDALLGTKCLHPGSKFIVTTKDASLTERCALFNPHVQLTHTQVLLDGLNYYYSLKLLCNHAFKSQYPKEGYEEVSLNLVKYCDGHPLALEVLGRSLQKQDVAYWEERINGLKKEPLSGIEKVKSALQMSINSLPSENDKELFKHIACFFVGMDRDSTETILNACDIYTRSGITHLIDRCLLSNTMNGKYLMMHQLVQDMGRDLVRQESPKKPEERSRLWCHEESFKVLKQKKGKGNILGLALDMRMLDKKKFHELETKSFSQMENLMLLKLNHVKLNGCFENFPEELRWLCMHGSPLKSFSLDLPMDNLVVLDMSYSLIKSFDMSCSYSQCLVSGLKRLIGSSSKSKPVLGSLKILDLSFCEQLHRVGGFFELPALERLILRNCTGLKSLPLDFQMENLVTLDMSYSNIESFDMSCSKPQPPAKRQKGLTGSRSKNKRLLGSLKILDLSSCQKLHNLGGFFELPALERLILKSCTCLTEVCESVEQCDELVHVDLSYCHNLRKLPIIIGKLKKVKTLLLDGCISRESQIEMGNMMMAIPSDLKLISFSLPSSLVELSLADNDMSNESFPMDFSSLSMLKKLFLDENPIVSVPNCVRTLPSLQILSMVDCAWLISIEHLPRTLRVLDYCELNYMNKDLGKIKFDTEMSPLKLEGLFRPYIIGRQGEVDGVMIVQDMESFDEKVLHSLGWIDLDLKKSWSWQVTDVNSGASYKYQSSQMIYQFGIFSTFYLGEEMPDCITCTSKGSSISFTIPSSPKAKKLRGLNFCCVNATTISSHKLPMIKIRNTTKNNTWIYVYSQGRLELDEEFVNYLSHWMFGPNQMEIGDHVTITVAHESYFGQDTEECGIGFVYEEDGDEKNGGAEEEDVLGYYKSWNHIIGGDLSGFQLTTGEYILDNRQFYRESNQHMKDLDVEYEPFISPPIEFKEEHVWFKAFSQKKKKERDEACDIRDPKQTIEWTVPEGGGGSGFQ